MAKMLISKDGYYLKELDEREMQGAWNKKAKYKVDTPFDIKTFETYQEAKNFYDKQFKHGHTNNENEQIRIYESMSHMMRD